MGAHKTDLRKKLDAMDLTYELRNFSLKQIAEKYETTIRMVHIVLTHQMKAKIELGQRNFTLLDSGYEKKMINAIGSGSWMLSDERQSLTKYKVENIE